MLHFRCQGNRNGRQRDLLHCECYRRLEWLGAVKAAAPAGIGYTRLSAALNDPFWFVITLAWTVCETGYRCIFCQAVMLGRPRWDRGRCLASRCLGSFPPVDQVFAVSRILFADACHLARLCRYRASSHRRETRSVSRGSGVGPICSDDGWKLQFVGLVPRLLRNRRGPVCDLAGT